jgi:hypothetical protein
MKYCNSCWVKMKKQKKEHLNFGLLFQSTIKDIVKHPRIILPGAIFLLLVMALSRISVFVNYRFQDTNSQIISLGIFIFIFLAISSFVFSSLAGFTSTIVKRKPDSKTLITSFKYAPKVFIVIIVALILTTLIRLASHYLSFFIGKALNLSLSPATFLFFLIYMIGLLGVLIFLTFSAFFIITKNSPLITSFKESIRLVKSRYVESLSLLIVFFILFFLLDYLPSMLGSIVEYAILLPFFVVLFTRFVIENSR